jgi:hypothetical protein
MLLSVVAAALASYVELNRRCSDLAVISPVHENGNKNCAPEFRCLSRFGLILQAILNNWLKLNCLNRVCCNILTCSLMGPKFVGSAKSSYTLRVTIFEQ